MYIVHVGLGVFGGFITPAVTAGYEWSPLVKQVFVVVDELISSDASEPQAFCSTCI